MPALERVHADVPGAGRDVPFDDALKLIRAEREVSRLQKRWETWEEREVKEEEQRSAGDEVDTFAQFLAFQ
jgi:hypothetical protein